MSFTKHVKQKDSNLKYGVIMFKHEEDLKVNI